MRLAFRIDLGKVAPCAALCTAIALIVLPIGANAQEAGEAPSATLTESAAPSTASAASDSQNEAESANTTVAIPNIATAVNMIRPTWDLSG